MRRGAPVFALSFTAALLLQGGADGGQQVAVVLEGGQVGVVLLDLVGTAEEKAGLPRPARLRGLRRPADRHPRRPVTAVLR